MRHFLLLTCIVFQGFLLSAQRTPTAVRFIQNAEIAMNRTDFKAAIIELKSALRAKKNYPVALRMLGFCYLAEGKFENASKTYDLLFSKAPNFSRTALFEWAQTFQYRQDYKSALEHFQRYKEAKPSKYKTDILEQESGYDALIDQVILNCEYAKNTDLTSEIQIAKNLGPSVNSAVDEYLPSVSYDGNYLLFTSRHRDEDIFWSKKKKNGGWIKARKFNRDLNSNRNEGMAKFNACGTKFYFAGCFRNDGIGGCDIFVTPFNEKGNLDIQPFSGPVNTEDWDSQPALSCDENTFYFASNRKGGFGGTDLYVTRRNTKGVWSKPENMGATINTPGDEEAPFIAPDGTTLYFASTGHPGYGDADLFMSRISNSNWSTPVNLGRSINSPAREAGIFVNSSGTEAVFASARFGGRGGMDLYQIELPKEIAPESKLLIRGIVKNYNHETLEARVKIGKSGKTIYKIETGKDGTFLFCLPDDQVYSLIVDAPGHEIYVQAEHFRMEPGELVKDIQILMTDNNIKIKENKHVRTTIYFESGESILTEEEKAKIDDLIQQIVSDDGTVNSLRVTAIGYADDVGDVRFNMNLSRKRAQCIAAYCVEKGIPSGQIIAEGKGEIDPTVEKDNNRKKKRRVELMITQ